MVLSVTVEQCGVWEWHRSAALSMGAVKMNTVLVILDVQLCRSRVFDKVNTGVNIRVSNKTTRRLRKLQSSSIVVSVTKSRRMW